MMVLYYNFGILSVLKRVKVLLALILYEKMGM